MFEIVQHTADIRIRVAAASVEELFADAVRALMEVMKPAATTGGSRVTIEIDAPDLTAVLVDLLNELLLRCHTRGEAFEPESFVLGERSVVARLVASPATAFEEDVKAVTYHEADVRRTTAGSWETRLVLDV